MTSADPPPAEISDGDWSRLEKCIKGDNDPECKATSAFTACPEPETVATVETQIADSSSPFDLKTVVENNNNVDNQAFPKKLRITWKYLNSLGGVPQRDDVRFNIAVKEVASPTNGNAPPQADYPSLEETRAKSSPSAPGLRSGDTIVLQDISFDGHRKWTDPAPTTSPRDFRVEVPARCNKRYLVRVVARRFCFDQSGDVYSHAEHTSFADVNCGQ